MSIVLGFDYGLRRIGVATGNTLTHSATPLTAVAGQISVGEKQQTNWEPLEKLIKEWRPDRLLVGQPLLVDGKRQPFTEKAEAFAAELGERSGITVELVDETLSSRAAESELKQQRQAGRKSKIRKAEIDAMAAKVIIETWLSEQH